MGNTKIAITDLNKAIGVDYLNHHAYFNLFSLQMEGGEHQAAFKNICCCLSVAHLLKSEREESVEGVEKAIEYCFNNKEARMLKSILKLKAKKNIEALNQINYALYLAPSHQSLKVVQEKVYQAMGMKELKGKNTPFQK
jgi:tetratricopeptide (TPR) repeat protein